MSVASFKKTVWAANLITALSKKIVSQYGVNNDYQGDVIEAGSVKINTMGKVVLKDYSGKAITYDDIDLKDQTLLIDHSKYFSLQLDDVDAAQLNSGEVMTKAMSEAAISIAEDRDTANFSAMVDGAGVNVSGLKVTTPAEAKSVLLKLKTKADKVNVPSDGRVFFCQPEFENILLADTTINLAPPTADDTIKAGYVGKLYGIEIYSTNNLPDNKIILTHPKFTTEASQIEKIEALRSENSFKDLVRGLSLSGRKVIMPEGVIVGEVTYEDDEVV
jgi:hypothetical protein